MLPDDVDPRLLDPEVRQALRSLTPPVADRVAKHLVVAGQLADEDPVAALAHARAARRLGGRLALVREAAGITAYLAGEWAEALNELRAARRMGGEDTLLHVMADCERALGRPERAVDIARGPEIAELPQELRVEMAIVEAGARRDLGQLDAALLVLQGQGLAKVDIHPWTPRLWYAYADALADAGRAEDAVEWFTSVSQIDGDETTDAEERLADLVSGGSTAEPYDETDAELAVEPPAVSTVQNEPRPIEVEPVIEADIEPAIEGHIEPAQELADGLPEAPIGGRVSFREPPAVQDPAE
ncbi:MAG TPA: hypothetical protein VHX59_14720 [Mycobacteriales bacterium]|nr:hypothetical protein [Mycobacteriales bacterium]